MGLKNGINLGMKNDGVPWKLKFFYKREMRLEHHISCPVFFFFNVISLAASHVMFFWACIEEFK